MCLTLPDVSKYKPTHSAGIIIAVVFGLSFPLFFMRGIGVFDDTIYLKIGELITSGFSPYRDAIDNKPPLLYLIAAIPALVAPGNWFAPRIMLFLFGIAFSSLIYRIANARYGSRSALQSVALFSTSYVICQGYSFHSEAWCSFFGLLGVLIVSRKSASSGALLGAGILFGLATLCKQVGILFPFSVMLWLAWEGYLGNSTKTSSFRVLWPMILGGTFVALASILALASLGIVSQAYDCIVRLALNEAHKSINVLVFLPTWLRTPVILYGLLLCIPLVSRAGGFRSITPECRLLLLSGVIALFPSIKDNSNTNHYLGVAVPLLSIALPALATTIRIPVKVNRFALVIAIVVGLTSLIVGSVMITRQHKLRPQIAFQRIFQNLLGSVPPRTPILVLTSSEPRWHYLSSLPPYRGHLYYRWPDRFDRKTFLEPLFRGEVPVAVIEVAPKPSPNTVTLDEMKKLQTVYDVTRLDAPESICPKDSCYLLKSITAPR